MQAERKCRTCDETFVEGRADKKFCSVECRNNHYNYKHRDRNNVMRNINNILRRNQLILKQFQSKGGQQISGHQLRDAGFRFDYFTNVLKSNASEVYNFCYEFGYRQLENDCYSLISKCHLEEKNSHENVKEDKKEIAQARVLHLRIA